MKNTLSKLLLLVGMVFTSFSYAQTIHVPGGAPNYKPSVASPASLPLSGNSTGDARVSKSDSSLYIWDGAAWQNSGGSAAVAWGSITGTLSSQTDLNTALSGKEPTITATTSADYYRGDKTFQTLNTLVVPELTNLYYTQARFDTAFGLKSTTNLTEGTNLYYTQGRFDAAFAAKNTDSLSEGVTNLYFTNARTLASVLTGYTSGSGVLSAADTVLSAIQKLNGNIGVISGSAITSLTGDGTASGPGASTFTLATVNATTGTFGSASSIPVTTVNGKGLTTNVVDTPIAIAESQVTNLVSDLAAKGDVSGPASAIDSEVAIFNGTTGKLIKRATGTGVAHLTSGVLSTSAVSLTADVSGVLPVSNGGTNKSSYTATNVIFAGAGGTTLTEDATGALQYDSTNKRLSINGAGTGKVNAAVTSGTDSSFTGFCTGTSNNCVSIQNQAAYTVQLTNAAASATAGATIGGAFSRGTLAARTQSLAGDQLFSLSSQGYTGSAFSAGLTNAISFVATENTGATAAGGQLIFSTTPNTTLIPVPRMVIGQSGVVNISNLTASLPVQTNGSKDLISAAITLSGSQVTGTLGVANGGTGITSLGAGVATWLGTPSSANLGAALTDETGSGFAVFSTSPALTGVPTAPTATAGTNTTQLATTAFVAGAVGSIITSSNIAANTTLSSAKKYYFGDPTGGTFTVTLPAASSNDGVSFIVKHVAFGSANNIAVATTGGDTVEGAAGDTIKAGEDRNYVSNGTSWYLGN